MASPTPIGGRTVSASVIRRCARSCFASRRTTPRVGEASGLSRSSTVMVSPLEVRRGRARRGPSRTVLRDGLDVRGVGALLALGHLELDFLSLFEGPESLTGYAGVMDEDIIPTFAGDEAEAFLVAEPFDGSAHVIPPSDA